MKQLQIIGNIGYDAVIKDSNGNKFVQFTVAVSESYKDKDGNKIEKTDWISCTSKVLTLSQYLTEDRRKLVEIEKIRVKYGLGQRTKIKIKL